MKLDRRQRSRSVGARQWAERAIGSVVMVGLLVAGVAGCARTSVQNESVKAFGLPRPQMIYVHDFGVSPSAVTLDSALGSRIMDMMKSTPEGEQQLQVAQQVAKVVTENLGKEIEKLGIPATAAANAAPVAGPSLSIEGRFVTVDEGNRRRRAIIGFGAGASDVRTLVQVFETTIEGRRLVEDFSVTVKSSRKPGLGPMAGAGGAAGRAAESAAVSAGVGLMTVRSQTVEGDAEHTAEQVAKELKKLFVEQGWIAPQ